MSKTILYVFAGRRPNIEVALPFYRRVVDEYPDVDVHIWDLARDPSDNRYLRTIPTNERLQVRTDFYSPSGKASPGQNRVWGLYARPEYRDCTFVKCDDDVLFLETGKLAEFIQAARNNPDAVVSALTINNGASTRHIPGIWAGYQQLKESVPPEPNPNPELASLLGVHKSAAYAEMCHRWFFDHWHDIVGQEGALVPSQDWLSINAIAYTWQTGRRIAGLIARRPPREIAGRFYTARDRLGDEGACNMQPRLIHTGFVAGHLNFGPQVRAMAEGGVVDELRKLYSDIGREYLAG